MSPSMLLPFIASDLVIAYRRMSRFKSVAETESSDVNADCRAPRDNAGNPAGAPVCGMTRAPPREKGSQLL